MLLLLKLIIIYKVFKIMLKIEDVPEEFKDEVQNSGGDVDKLSPKARDYIQDLYEKGELEMGTNETFESLESLKSEITDLANG